MNSSISNNNLKYNSYNSYNPQEKFMRLAISQAKKAGAWTHPNPQVGAVIVSSVKSGEKILALGYHHNYGNLHAERDALKNAFDNGIDVKDGTIYVTLEPCCHFGKQPPCTQAIIESGIKNVVIGSRDPNPLVNGKGVKILEDAGINVIQDFLRDECDEINRIFFHFIKFKTPYVIVKYAMSADGETSCANGNSKWITGEAARENVHKTRSNVMGVMTGINTVLKDNPLLNVRLDNDFYGTEDFMKAENFSRQTENSLQTENSQQTENSLQEPAKFVQETEKFPSAENSLCEQKYFQPTRIICDSSLKIPMESQIVKTAKIFPVIVACKKNLSSSEELKKAELEKSGICVLQIEERFGQNSNVSELNLEDLLFKLAQKGIDSVLVESGGVLNGSLFFEKNLVNEVHVYVGAQIFGNKDNLLHSPVQKKGVDFPKDSIKLSKPKIEFFGDDVLLKYFLC